MVGLQVLFESVLPHSHQMATKSHSFRQSNSVGFMFLMKNWTVVERTLDQRGDQTPLTIDFTHGWVKLYRGLHKWVRHDANQLFLANCELWSNILPRTKSNVSATVKCAVGPRAAQQRFLPRAPFTWPVMSSSSVHVCFEAVDIWSQLHRTWQSTHGTRWEQPFRPQQWLLLSN